MAVRFVCLSVILSVITTLHCADDFDNNRKVIDTTCKQDNQYAAEDLSIREIYDGIDNNCNGLVDENYLCEPSTIKRCWPQDNDVYQFLKNPELGLNSALSGECRHGQQFCKELEIGSAWGIMEDGADSVGGTQDDIWVQDGCVGSVLPATEQCDGLDNNCDGKTDEGLKKSCWSGPVNQNTSHPADYLVFYDAAENPDGLCKLGTQLCQDGGWSGCLYEALPTNELCDGLDNDCDGEIDEHTIDTQSSCGLTDAGACQFGLLSCISGQSGTDIMCQNAILPENEVCDNVDNDCDSETDEELYRRCETICETGIEMCYSGNWIDCTAEQPRVEECNGEDDDCDGLIDEELECVCPPEFIGLLIPCKKPELVCGLGFFTCECANAECSTTIQSECKAVCAFQELQDDALCNETMGLSEAEVCNNWDDDCDGLIDEDLFRDCYSGPVGTFGVGLCSGDIQICDSGRWGQIDNNNHFVEEMCDNQVFPALEICDGDDNDCDGLIDEELDRHDKVDMVFVIDRSGSMCNKINALRDGIRPYIADFANTEHRFAIVNVPWKHFGGPVESDVLIDLSDAITLIQTLDTIDCSHGGLEPQYDAVFNIATQAMQISFRDDAWPMLIVVTDELAQSVNNINAQSIQQAITPCIIGLCTPDDTLEIYSLVPNQFFVEWCAPANIAQKCYDLPDNITSQQITEYLNEIFSDVCR